MKNEEKSDDGSLRRTVGHNVERIRSLRGLSRRELGQLIGRSETLVVAIETGEGRLMISDLAFLSTALQVSPADLLTPPEDDSSFADE